MTSLNIGILVSSRRVVPWGEGRGRGGGGKGRGEEGRGEKEGEGRGGKVCKGNVWMKK